MKNLINKSIAAIWVAICFTFGVLWRMLSIPVTVGGMMFGEFGYSDSTLKREFNEWKDDVIASDWLDCLVLYTIEGLGLVVKLLFQMAVGLFCIGITVLCVVLIAYLLWKVPLIPIITVSLLGISFVVIFIIKLTNSITKKKESRQ